MLQVLSAENFEQRDMQIHWFHMQLSLAKLRPYKLHLQTIRQVKLTYSTTEVAGEWKRWQVVEGGR